MLLRAEQLAAHLARGPLARLYTVAGDEALLAIEAQDAIRAAARAQGFAEREVLHADARFDWSRLQAAVLGGSLFSSRRMVEIRLPGGKPGVRGAAALQQQAARDDEGLLALVCLPKLDRAARASQWATALESRGVWIEVPRIERERLPEWAGARLARQGQTAGRQALQLIADRVEGNLLAAHQEISKLGLLYGAGPLSFEQIRDGVFDVARYEVYGLPQAMLAADRARVLRLVEGLRAEGEPLPLLLWVVSEELRNLLRLKRDLDAGRPFAVASRGMRLAAPPPVVERALARVDATTLADLLARCADIDRVVKGLRAPRCDGDPWLELADLALVLCTAPTGKTA
jgi:DNA polymerase-3 subunit delta